MGALLVTLQFALLALLALLAAPALAHGSIAWPAWLLAAASVSLGLWTLAHNRIGNFNIRPTPKASGRLVTSGPYQHVRHPMYGAVLLGAAALAWVAPAWAWLAWAALCGVLWHKSSLEEAALSQRYPDYAAYRQRSHRFLPWLL